MSSELITSRRGFLAGFAGFLIAAPAIIRVARAEIMPVKVAPASGIIPVPKVFINGRERITSLHGIDNSIVEFRHSCELSLPGYADIVTRPGDILTFEDGRIVDLVTGGRSLVA
jgi:hypothetical protein